uniref:C-type lectin domain-containing protein n=1 Tax=Latimeria chalumnae TaxID=7897 RepID=H3A5A3_LATCH
CPRDWLYFGGSCYFFSNNAMTWVSSKENCTSLGAHLVVITSKEEQIFIQEQLVVQKLKVVYWIGLNDMTMEGNWQWVDGTAYKEHLFWIRGQPDNTNEEDCATIGGWPGFKSLMWNDDNCGVGVNRIC